MSNTASLKQGMLDACNQLREERGALPLNDLPIGQPSVSSDCTGHRALRDLGLGDFQVLQNSLQVNAEFADIIARTWNTTTSPGRDDQVLVALPEAMIHFIAAFDNLEIPEITILDQADTPELIYA